jgi:hypothetical protein
MPAIQDPNIGLNYGWVGGESGINLQLDENWKAISTLLKLSVLSRTTDVPASVTNGDRYIIPAGATGAWTGYDGKVARYISGVWEVYTPTFGWTISVLDEMQQVTHDGTNWQLPGGFYTQYADDPAASTGGVAVGGVYINSTTGALYVRMT